MRPLEHQGMLRPEPYKSRTWCRVEQLAYCCQSGVEKMFVTTSPGQLSPLEAGWMEQNMCIMDGATTCCRLGHPGGSRCDKEFLVSPLMALFFELCTKQSSGEAEATEFVVNILTKMKDKIFPHSFDYKDSSGRTTRRLLFGNMISMLEARVKQDLIGSVEMCRGVSPLEVSRSVAQCPAFRIRGDYVVEAFVC